jgi:putative RecB family exonuclease
VSDLRPIVLGMHSTVVPPAVVTLSPSRAADFKSCPLLYRFRAIDRLPEPPSPEAVRGTLVHAVLERLFDVPPAARTPDHATRLAAQVWRQMVDADPDLVALLGPPAADTDAWLAAAGALLDAYFTMEDPRRLEPAERELVLEADLGDGLRLKGILDRLDVAPEGDMRVVDYKTGRAPAELFEQRALFQLRFYALLLWRTRGQVPRLLQLIYLSDRQVVRLEPHEADLRALERTLRALTAAIEKATRTGDFRPRRSRLCDWCPHQSLCPQWGGTPPPLPAPASAEPVEPAETSPRP